MHFPGLGVYENKKNPQNHYFEAIGHSVKNPSVVIHPKKLSLRGDWGKKNDFFRIFRPYRFGDFLKIKYKKVYAKSSLRGDCASERVFFAYF